MNDHLVMLNGTKRVDESERIILASCKVFLEKGYTNTRFSDIANEAGVSEGDLVRLYNTKENLYTKLVFHILNIDEILEGCSDLLEMLVSVIEEIKETFKDKAEEVEFLTAFFLSRDIPVEIRKAIQRKIESSTLYEALGVAQIQGKVISGDTYEVIKRFVMATFDFVRGFTKAGMQIPQNDWFLSILQYSDDISSRQDKELIKQQSSVIAAFVADYQSILFVDLDMDNIDVYQANGENDNWIVACAQKGYEEYRRRFCDKFIFPEDRDWFMSVTSADNIKRRLEDEPIYYIDHRVIYHGESKPYQTKIVLDPMYSYGNRVLIGGHKL